MLVCMAVLAAGSVGCGWPHDQRWVLAAISVLLVLVVLTEEPGEAAVRAGEQGWGGDAVGRRLESAALQGRGGALGVCAQGAPPLRLVVRRCRRRYARTVRALNEVAENCGSSLQGVDRGPDERSGRVPVDRHLREAA